MSRVFWYVHGLGDGDDVVEDSPHSFMVGLEFLMPWFPAERLRYTEVHVGLRVKNLSLLSDFKQNWKALISINKIPQYQVQWNICPSFP